MPDGAWLVILVLLVGLISSVPVVAAGLWERRPIQPYYIPDVGQEYPPSATALQSNAQLEHLGFRHECLCHDGKGQLYRVRYDFWTSPDGIIFAIVGSGFVASVPVDGIWLYSRTTNGRIVCTNNIFGEQDVSGVEELETWPHLNAPKLVAKHADRLLDVNTQPFEGDSALAACFEIRRAKADALVQRRFANYLDHERSVWRYTLRGAIAFYFVAVWIRPFHRLLRSIGLVRT